MPEHQIQRAVDQRHFAACNRAMANQHHLMLPAAFPQRSNNPFHTPAGCIQSHQIGMLLQQGLSDLSCAFGPFMTAYRLKHPLTTQVFAQVRSKADFAGFLTQKTVIADNDPDIALPMAQALHRPAGGTACLLVIPADITGTAVYR
ncbi:hypothetical protein D3C80_1584560 [compost metagenome]